MGLRMKWFATALAFCVLAGCERKAEPPRKEPARADHPARTDPEPEKPKALTLLCTDTAHKADVSAIVFHPDGKHILSGSTDGIRVWEAETGKETRWWIIQGKVTGIVLHPAGRSVLVSVEGGGVSLRSLDAGEVSRVWKGAGTVLGCRLGGMFFAGRGLWGSDDQRPTATVPKSFTCAAVAGQGLLTDGGVFEVLLWDEELKSSTVLGQHPDPVRKLVVSRDGTRAYSASNDALKVWGLETHVELASWTGPSRGVKAMAISPDGRKLALGGAGLSLLDAKTGKEILRKENEPVVLMDFSPDGKRLVTVSGRTIKVWALPE